MVLAWKIEKALQCPDCGTYYEEWDPKQGGHVHAYFPRERFCLGCKAKQDKYSAIRENAGDRSDITNGLQMTLVRNENLPNIKSPVNNKPIPPTRMK